MITKKRVEAFSTRFFYGIIRYYSVFYLSFSQKSAGQNGGITRHHYFAMEGH